MISSPWDPPRGWPGSAAGHPSSSWQQQIQLTRPVTQMAQAPLRVAHLWGRFGGVQWTAPLIALWLLPGTQFSFRYLLLTFFTFHAFIKKLPRHLSPMTSMTKAVFKPPSTPPTLRRPFTEKSQFHGLHIKCLLCFCGHCLLKQEQVKNVLVYLICFLFLLTLVEIVSYYCNRYLINTMVKGKYQAAHRESWRGVRQTGSRAGKACQSVVCKNSGAGNVVE